MSSHLSFCCSTVPITGVLDSALSASPTLLLLRSFGEFHIRTERTSSNITERRKPDEKVGGWEPESFVAPQRTILFSFFLDFAPCCPLSVAPQQLRCPFGSLVQQDSLCNCVQERRIETCCLAIDAFPKPARGLSDSVPNTAPASMPSVSPP